jgi:hypothetical protein
VSAHALLNPGRPPRFDAPAVVRRLGRVVLVAPSFAILLVLAAAGAASAADGPDLVEAAQVAPVVPPVDPITTVATPVAGLEPVKDRVVKTAVQALPDGAAHVAKAIVGGAEDELGSVAPVPIPAVIPPDLFQGPEHIVQPGRPQSRTADDAEPTHVRPITLAAAAQEFDGHLALRALKPETPLGPIDLAGTAAIGVSGTGPGPWLGHGPRPRVPPTGSSGFPPAIPFAMPRGLTPRPLVPPG